MVSLFRRLAKELADTLSYSYPEATNKAVSDYYTKVSATDTIAPS